MIAPVPMYRMTSGSASIAMSGPASGSSGRLRMSRAVLNELIDCRSSGGTHAV